MTSPAADTLTPRPIGQAFPHRRARHCAAGALARMLEHAGLSYGREPVSEAFAFGLSGGLDFEWTASPRPDPWPAMPSGVWLMGRRIELEDMFWEHVGAQVVIQTSDDPRRGWEWVAEEIDAGRPVMLRAELGEMEYLDVPLRNAHHVLVVVGYDESRALVSDGETNQLQWCSLACLSRARAIGRFPTPTEHRSWLVRLPDQLPPAEDAIRRAVGAAARTMRTAQRDPCGTGEPCGLAAVRSFARDYPDWPDRFGADLAAALKRLRFFISHAGTGGGLFRRLQSEFLFDAAALLDDEALRECAHGYARLARTWTDLARTVRDKDAARGHRAGVPIVASIEELEHEGVERLEAAARRL
ncbi:MAG: BtrH N-terminal domain-containing protein [Gaiellaceae bacterium]